MASDETRIAGSLITAGVFTGFAVVERSSIGILPEDTILGQLEIIEVLGYYDGPYLMSCRNKAGHTYLALAVDEEEGADVWFYVPVSPERLEFVRTGGLTLHDAFAAPESKIVLRVAVPFVPGPAHVELVHASDLRPELLPDATERLNLRAIPKTLDIERNLS